MVRTRDGGDRKAVAAKAPRKVLASSSASSLGSPNGKAAKFSGGNSVCARPTPDWQKGIGGFLTKSTNVSNKENSQLTDDDDDDASKNDDVPSSAAGSSSSTSVSQDSADVGASSSSSSMSVSQDSADVGASSSSSTTSVSQDSAEDSSHPEPTSPSKKNGLISDSDDE